MLSEFAPFESPGLFIFEKQLTIFLISHLFLSLFELIGGNFRTFSQFLFVFVTHFWIK